MYIVTDDLIPCIANESFFAKSEPSELWFILLQKAWAKLHGGYFTDLQMQAGDAMTRRQQTVRDLCGAPGFVFDSIEDLDFEKIIEFGEASYIMFCETKTGAHTEPIAKEYGLEDT